MFSPASLKILAFTNGRNSPSARFRVRQHIHPLLELGVDLVERESTWTGRAGRGFANTIGHAGFALAHRACDVAYSHRFSGSLLQRWMLSRFPTLEFAARSPKVLDVDDAIWQDSGPSAISRLAVGCRGIICGNSFLAERFSAWNPNVTVIPTAVDTMRFRPRDTAAIDGPQIICWSGSSSNLHYLHGIEKALSAVLQANPNARLRVVCNSPPRFTRIPASRTEYVEWSEDREVSAIQDCSVGIMPLDDTEWVRGKCSFKMLCYMACGIPAVVSPFGMNNEVLALGHVGFAARAEDDWVDALVYLLKNPDVGAEMGANGRSIVRQQYSVCALAPKLAGALRQFIEVA